MKNPRTTTVLALIAVSALAIACEQKSGKPTGSKTESAAKSAAESADQTAADAIKSSTETPRTK